MRTLPSDVAVKTLEEDALGYSREEAMREAQRAGSHDFAAASEACPFRVNVARLVGSIGAGDFDAALGTVLQAHPWPGILGRHCHRYCETADRRGAGMDEVINISGLERAAGDHAHRERYPFRPGPATGKRVAIIGAGSAASAAAYRLRQLGHHVVVYEQLPVAGGMMFVGYPNFRLPLRVLRAENQLEEWGVETNYNRRVDADLFTRIVAEYDAVLLGTGHFKAVRAGIPGENLAGVWDALHFLTEFKLGHDPAVGQRVVVLGAGFSAQDVSRTCRRLGRAVAVLYRRGPEEMPIFPHLRARFIARQAAEGAPFQFNVAPVRILGEHGRVVGIECVRTEPGAPDRTGRPDPVPVAASNFALECDTVIEATGETADVSFLPREVQLTDPEHVRVDPRTWMTSMPKLFACGELAGTGSTGMAFSSGFRAADSIDAFLRGP